LAVRYPVKTDGVGWVRPSTDVRSCAYSNNAQVNQSITESSVQHTWHRYAVKQCILAGLFKSLCLRTVCHSIYSRWCIILPVDLHLKSTRISVYSAVAALSMRLACYDCTNRSLPRDWHLSFYLLSVCQQDSSKNCGQYWEQQADNFASRLCPISKFATTSQAATNYLRYLW